MGDRCFARLINAYSEKVETDAYQVVLYFMYFNFCRIHKCLRVMAAMETGITDHVMKTEEMMYNVILII